MKIGKISLLLSLLSVVEIHAATKKAEPEPAPAFDPKGVRVLPFINELAAHELKMSTAGVPDVLAVSRTVEKVRILGTRFQKGPFYVMSQSVSYVGKLALLPPTCVSGSLQVRDMTTNIGISAVLELPDQVLSPQSYRLKKGAKYTWVLEVEDERTSLKIKDSNGNVLNDVTGSAPKVISGVAVTGVGFASTCSKAGEKVDLEFTYTAPK